MKKIIVLSLGICLVACFSLSAQTLPLEGGTITLQQTVSRSTASVTLTGSAVASGGSGLVTYSWEASTDDLIWTPISGAASASYTPRPLTVDTYFRRKVTLGPQTAYSNTVAISATRARNNSNYILTHTYTAENDSISVADINYYDGLGYSSQSISIGASTGKYDIVSPVYYDVMKRQSRQYLPYLVYANSGKYRPEALAEQVRYYNNNYGSNAGGYSYAESVYEASPLNRVTASYQVGNVFRTKDKKTTFDYGTNAENEVMRFKVNSQVLETSGFYNANTLFKNTATNEDGTSAVTYKDFLDRIILERVLGRADDNVVYDTYYVYDDIGNLCYVLPPKLSATAALWGSGAVSEQVIKELAYVYRYDGRNRCIEKRLPGADPIYMVYDKADRMVMSQDGNMRDLNRWIYTEFDALSRPVRQSILVSQGAVTSSTLQNSFNAATVANPYNPLNSGFSESITMTTTAYDAYVHEDATELITMDRIPIGTNIRGWTFKVTRTELNVFLPNDDLRFIYLNGKEWISFYHYSGDPIAIDCNVSIKATEETVVEMCHGVWSISEGYIFTIKDDQDYIVTANDLPASSETIWGFDRVVRVRRTSI